MVYINHRYLSILVAYKAKIDQSKPIFRKKRQNSFKIWVLLKKVFLQGKIVGNKLHCKNLIGVFTIYSKFSL